MSKRYRKEIVNGKTRFVQDPNGKEMWQLSAKGYKSKPGRKPKEDARRALHIYLPADMYDWLHEQPEGITAIIEMAVKKEMDNNNSRPI